MATIRESSPEPDFIPSKRRRLESYAFITLDGSAIEINMHEISPEYRRQFDDEVRAFAPKASTRIDCRTGYITELKFSQTMDAMICCRTLVEKYNKMMI